MAVATSDLARVVSALKGLEQRVYQLEETQNVKDFMTEWALKLDLIEFSKTVEDAQALAEDYMTVDGTIETPLGKWGPEKEHLVRSFLNFAKDPEMPDEPRPTAQGIDWAVHLYFHRTIDFEIAESGEETAHFKAREMVPLVGNAKAQWWLIDNDSVLKKVDVVVNGGPQREWRMHRYGLKGLNIVENSADAWAQISPDNGAEIFESRGRPYFQRRLNRQ